MMRDGSEPVILCDSHMHVFSRDGMTKAATYVPPAKDISDFQLEATVGQIGRAVIIQASIDGTDNARLHATLVENKADADSELELRGVAMIDEHSSGLVELAEAGAKALRIQDRARLGINDLVRLPGLAKRGAEVNWHVELNTKPARYDQVQAMLPALALGQFLVLDHFGHCDPSSASDIDALCRLLDSGKVWVKLAPTRVSQQVGSYEDLLPLVEVLASRYTERCIWGSDWPHVMTPDPVPSTIDMLNFYRQAMTSAQFTACFSANPATLYGFA